MGFKKRIHLHNLKVQSEVTNTDVEVVACYPEDLDNIINKSCHIKQNVFSVDKRVFYWKKMSSRNFIAVEDEPAPGFKASKDRQYLLSGITAVSVFKLKLVLTYQPRKLRTLINYDNCTLPLNYKWNNKA